MIQNKHAVNGNVTINNQKVIGVADGYGSNHSTRTWLIECLNCDYRYAANGCDVYLRKCPACQNGKPGLPRSGD